MGDETLDLRHIFEKGMGTQKINGGIDINGELRNPV